MKAEKQKEDERQGNPPEPHNALCEQCVRDCKQLATAQVIYCPNYLCGSSMRGG